MLHRINSYLNRALRRLVSLYVFISPSFHFVMHFLGAPFQCKYPVSCSRFALDEFSGSKNVLVATRRVMMRLICCSPLNVFARSHDLKGI